MPKTSDGPHVQRGGGAAGRKAPPPRRGGAEERDRAAVLLVPRNRSMNPMPSGKPPDRKGRPAWTPCFRTPVRRVVRPYKPYTEGGSNTENSQFRAIVFCVIGTFIGMTTGCRVIDPTEARHQQFLYTMSNIEPADDRIHQQEHHRNLRDRSQGVRVDRASTPQRSDCSRSAPISGRREGRWASAVSRFAWLVVGRGHVAPARASWPARSGKCLPESKAATTRVLRQIQPTCRGHAPSAAVTRTGHDLTADLQPPAAIRTPPSRQRPSPRSEPVSRRPG